jgi:hypothetical protein
MMLVVGCGHKQYVGLQAQDIQAPWCDYYPGFYPAFGEGKKCVIQQGALLFDFIIKKGEDDQTYIIEGFIDATQGKIKSFDTLIEGQSRFFMLVANGNRIVDNVTFRPQTVYGGLGSRMPFRIAYRAAEGLSQVTFGYRISVSG